MPPTHVGGNSRVFLEEQNMLFWGLGGLLGPGWTQGRKTGENDPHVGKHVRICCLFFGVLFLFIHFSGAPVFVTVSPCGVQRCLNGKVLGSHVDDILGGRVKK